MSSVRITCGSQELRRVGKTTYTDCETLCKEDSNCKFMYHVPGEYCLTYPSCNVTRTATETIGSTYSKDGNCPGSTVLIRDWYRVSHIYFALSEILKIITFLNK